MENKARALETLPNVAPSATATGGPDPAVTVLLVDSDPVMRAVFRDALQSPGYHIVEAGELGTAVDRLNETHPDLLIIRPYISGMTGRTAANYLRTKQHGLPVLILSGWVEDDRLRNRSTVEDFFTFPQPFSRNALLAKVKDVLSHTKAQRVSRVA